jgi:hypothetical protein
MSGCIITETELQDIPDAGGRSWDVLERHYPLFRQKDGYIRKILDSAQ